MARKEPLYPHITKSRRPPDEKRVTTMTDRFTIDCSYCGFISSERTLTEAIRTAQGLKQRGRHATPEEKITIFDRLAQRGACNTWDVEGHCIGHKEWK